MKVYMVWFRGNRPERISLVPPKLLNEPVSKIKAVSGATTVVTASSFGEAIAEATRQMNYKLTNTGRRVKI